MPRNLTIQCPEAPPVSLPPGYVRETYTIKVITPIFGGGVETGRNDPITPFRVPAIRGHLRFWWRATSGVRAAKTIAELRQLEGELWGTTRDADGKPRESRVSLEVDQPAGNGTPWNHPTHISETLSYVFGMLTGDNAVVECVSYSQPFRLTVTCPESLAGQVRVALWAWTNFGGLGARTRRGCGALVCTRVEPDLGGQYPLFSPKSAKTEDLKEWYSGWAQLFAGTIDASLAKVPALAESLLVFPSQAPGSAMDAWKQAIKVFREFRQGANVGRDPAGSGNNFPGQSRWPEPDAVQRLIPSPGWTWGHPIRTAHDGFPKAAFGLPIQFTFKERPNKPTAKLTAVETDRMASPIIARPLAIGGYRQNQAVPAILRLSVADLDAARLEQMQGGSGTWTIAANQIQDSGLSTYPASPMGGSPPRSTSGSALEAFLAYAKECGFEEVHP